MAKKKTKHLPGMIDGGQVKPDYYPSEENKAETNVVNDALMIENSPKDNSIYCHQRDKIKKPLFIKKKAPLTEKQIQFLDLVMSKKVKVIFVSGPAGSSKTFISIYAALLMLNAKMVSDLIYVRAAIESSDKSLGFLPGDLKDKLSPYLQPLEEKLDELLITPDITFLKKEERIIPMPVGFMRGSNWNAKVVVADEAQNMTDKELTTLMTRIGEFSHLFICGDPMQSDIYEKSAFIPFYNMFNDEDSKENGIYTFEFTEDDIVRSALVKYIIKKLKSFNNKK